MMELHTTLADSILNNQQIYLAKVDSIDEIFTRLAEGQTNLYGEIDSIQKQLQYVIDNGTGYSNAVAIIAIPLIIALFAFAFTYLFSVITRINEKYNSEHISGMFKTCLPYRCYMLGSAISVGYIILIGVLSLVLRGGEVHEVFMAVMNWTSLFVAGGYAAIILWFVHTCLNYDDHQKMLGLIEARYNKEKSNTWALNIRTQRLTDLCLYAERTQNANLSAIVMNRVNELDKTERIATNKNTTFYTKSFYESIVESYIQSPHDSEAERSLLWNWSRTFRHDMVPYTGVIYNMLGKMVEAVKRGRLSLFEVFMENCKLRYDYINEIPKVSYAKGENVDVLKKTEEECLDTWRELREVHYLAVAHLFTIGHYEVAGVLRKSVGNSSTFFPTTAAQILKNYANSKEKQDEKTGSFFRISQSMSINKVIGHKYDLEMLEKFTAMMLLLSVEPDGEEEYLLDEKKRKLIENKRTDIVKFGQLWSQHNELLRLYPTIQDRKIEDIIEQALSRLTNGEIPKKKARSGKTGKDAIQTLYDLKLSEQEKGPVRELFDTIIYNNRSSITDGLNGDWKEDKKDVVSLGAYTFLTSKEIVLNKEIWRHPSVFNDMLQVFRSRYIYIVFEALSQMKVKDVEMKWGEFERMFTKYVGENGEHYVIMDTECSVDALVKMDPLREGQKWPFHRYYKRAYYYNTGYGTMFNLRDVPLAESYDKTVILVKFADLPVLESVAENGRPVVTVEDEPQRDKGWASVRVTADPKLVAKYSKNAEVIRLRLSKK
ncbi:MAG: hypothetical protein K6A98_06600 [Prevotella sp.]|nr:hypothetical protein [Prevotella sp.]